MLLSFIIYKLKPVLYRDGFQKSFGWATVNCGEDNLLSSTFAFQLSYSMFSSII